MPALFVYVTAPDLQVARTIGRSLVEERLAACANVIEGMRSIYWWQGRVEEAAETVLILKTVDTNLTALIERVEALHPYETPCVTAFKVEDGARGYLDWIQAETRSQT